MWKKEESGTSNPTRPPGPDTPANAPQTQAPPDSSERATIGRSITIHGEVTGDEDLLIQGSVDGSVELKQQAVTIGQEGRVTAAITGRLIVVEGEVEGDLKGQEQVVLRSTARVLGDIFSPRVVLEDGASFTGGIDMGEPRKQGTVSSSHGPSASKASSPSASTPGASVDASTGKKAAEGSGSDSDKADD